MAEQRQAFRFRLPWAAAGGSGATRPNQVTQAPSFPAQPSGPANPVKRRPFRPSGQSPAKADTPPVSPSSTQKDPPSRIPSRSAPQQMNSPSPRGPRGSLSPSSSSPSSSRGISQETKSITPETKSPTKEQPATAEIKERRKEISLPLSGKTQLKNTETPETEKAVDALKEKTELLVSEKIKLKQTLAINPEPEVKQESINKIYDASSKDHTEMLKGVDHQTWDKKPVTDEKPSKPENVFDRKGVLKIFGSNEHATKGPHVGHDKGNIEAIKEDLPKNKHKLGNKGGKHELNEKSFSFITLTGENTGAIMHLTSERGKRETPIHIHRGYKSNYLDGNVDEITKNEGSSRGRKATNSTDKEEPRKNIYVNNNVQGINNSLVLNSSVSERNPGAHVVLLQNKAAESVKQGKEEDIHKMNKAEVSTVPAERFTYTPNIRRRCLKGLFLESSDSNPENTGKPRRHGCQVGREM